MPCLLWKMRIPQWHRSATGRQRPIRDIYRGRLDVYNRQDESGFASHPARRIPDTAPTDLDDETFHCHAE